MADSTADRTDEWLDALDAMETWVRRTREAARAGEPAPEADRKSVV